MTPRLPAVLSTLDLPLAELLAARLDGEVFAVGTGFAPVDEFEQPAHRAAALGSGLNPRLIAEQRSAAWIWGALAVPPAPHEFCAALDARVAHRLRQWATVREVMLEAQDVVVVAGLQVTTPLRTAVDLARFSKTYSNDERIVIEALMAIGGFTVGDCVTVLNRGRNLPFKTLAVERLSRS